ALVDARGAFCLRQVTARATERQVAHHGLTALRSRQDVFNVESHSSRGLKQTTILARTSGASGDELPERIGLRHVLALRMFGLNPNRDGHRTRGRTTCVALSKLCQPLG